VKNIIFIFSIILILFTACKNWEEVNLSLPTKITNFKGKNLEISQRNGTTPSIVLISGFNSELGTWNPLFQKLDPFISWFAFNRAGVGKSENVNGKRDALTIAQETKAILEANQVKPPYILVAHSMGGVYARMFYHLYPNQVKGIVLIDATHEKQIDTLLTFVPEDQREFILSQMEQQQNSDLAEMPESSTKEEFRANFRENFNQISTYPNIQNIPIYVLTSTKTENEEEEFVKTITVNLHRKWAEATGNLGKFVVTEKSGHYIQVEEPWLVKQAIDWVLKQP
jgi:pimeloyl-ACP methyl ester carboxylesterase